MDLPHAYGSLDEIPQVAVEPRTEYFNLIEVTDNLGASLIVLWALEDLVTPFQQEVLLSCRLPKGWKTRLLHLGRLKVDPVQKIIFAWDCVKSNGSFGAYPFLVLLRVFSGFNISFKPPPP